MANSLDAAVVDSINTHMMVLTPIHTGLSCAANEHTDNDDEDVDDFLSSGIATEDTDSLQFLWPGLICGALLLGGFMFPFCLGITNTFLGPAIQSVPVLLHLVIVYLPWIAHATGDGSCQNGGPWWQHLAYTAIVIVAAPALTGLVLKEYYTHGKDIFQLPLVGKCLSASAPFLAHCLGTVFVYTATVATAGDQYLDVNTIVLAKSCAYQYWPYMTGLYVGSLAIQALASFSVFVCGGGDAIGGFLWALGTLAGLNPDTMAASKDGGDNRRARALTKAMSAVSLLRFLTESVPQAGFAIHFAAHQQLQGAELWQVYFSVAFSLAIGLKSVVNSIVMLC